MSKVDIPTDEQLGTEAGFEEFLYLVEVYQARDAIQCSISNYHIVLHEAYS